jgi:hypothetical protein
MSKSARVSPRLKPCTESPSGKGVSFTLTVKEDLSDSQKSKGVKLQL